MNEIPRISKLDPKFREPRTIAEMLPARRAELAAHRVPKCPSGHGEMVARPLESQTYEQMYCGIWYDCKLGLGRCANSISYTSRELAQYHGQPYNDGTQWWKYQDGAWATISSDEAARFWATLDAWQNARVAAQAQPKRRRSTRHAA